MSPGRSLDRALGLTLARAGLTERALCTCFGVAAIAHLPRALPHRADPGPRPPRAALPLWLFCAGRAIDADAARAAFGDELDRLLDAGLLARDRDTVVAPRALLPIGPSIAVFDRLDADPVIERDLVPWPDDSSHHLIACLPAARAARWLDVGSGPAFAPLAAPTRGNRIRATDVSPRAISCARDGLALSGVAHVEAAVADLAAGAGGGWDLVTFNAPIPVPGDPILARFWADAPSLVAPGGAVLVHSVVGADPFEATAALPGERVIARYAPGFAITRWRPDAPAARALVDVTLTAEAPHVTRAVLDAAAGA